MPQIMPMNWIMLMLALWSLIIFLVTLIFYMKKNNLLNNNLKNDKLIFYFWSFC